MKKGQLFTFKIPFRKETLSGIILNYNDEWVLIRRISEYRLDGYTIFENTDKLIYSRGVYEKFVTRILNKKKYNYKKDLLIPISDTVQMLNEITQKYILIQLDARKGDAFDVVKFVGTKSDVFLFKELTVNAKWRYNLQLQRREIVCISYDNDYLNSLKLVI